MYTVYPIWDTPGANEHIGHDFRSLARANGGAVTNLYVTPVYFRLVATFMKADINSHVYA